MNWKKEISLRPRRRGEGEAPAPEPEPAAAPVDEGPPKPAKTPFWKRDLSLGRKRTADAPADAAPADAPTSLSGSLFGVPPRSAAAAELQRVIDEYASSPLPVVDVEVVDVVDVAAVPVDPAEPADAPGGDYGWLTASLDGGDDAQPWAAPAAEPAAAEPVPAPVPTPTPAPSIPGDAAASRPAPPAAPPGIHPPVPASELPPLEDEEPKAKGSFLRREISLARKPKAPKAEKPPKEPKEKKRKREKPAKAENDHVPFWKRDLSLGRKPKQATAPAAEAPAAADEPKPAKAKAKAPKRARGEKGGSRHKRVVGLKIGASQLAAAEVVNNGSAQLVKLARVPLPHGVVVAGELREPDALAEALKAFFAANKLPKRNVRLGIATNRIGVRSLDLEGIEDPKQLANAIRFRAQEALPIPIEDAVLDYHVISEAASEEGPPVRRVLLVVAYRELIERYVEACRKAGIKLVGIDLEAFALLRALGAPRAEADEPGDAAKVVVSIGYDRSTFAVSDGRVCEFTRVLEWGGFSVDVAVARVLDLSPSQAEPFKLQLSPHGTEVPEGLTAEAAEAARDAMRKQITTFARELVSSLQFYQNQPGSLSIGGITITGGTAHMDGLAQELERLIGVPVTVGDPLGRVRTAKKLKAAEPVGSLAVAIGLGIED